MFQYNVVTCICYTAMNPCIYPSLAPIFRGPQSLLNGSQRRYFCNNICRGPHYRGRKPDKTEYYMGNSRQISILRKYSPDTARKIMNQSSQEQPGNYHIPSMPFIPPPSTTAPQTPLLSHHLPKSFQGSPGDSATSA